jgi:hypothetical protein
MRKILQIAATILLFAATLSTASFGSDPIPTCPPDQPQCFL